MLTRLVEEGGDPRAIIEREGLGAMTAEDDGLGQIVDRAIASDPAAADQVRSGNMKAIGPLVGFVMRETKGRADGGEDHAADPASGSGAVSDALAVQPGATDLR